MSTIKNVSESIYFPVEQPSWYGVVVYVILNLQFDYKIHRAPTNGTTSLPLFMSLLCYFPGRGNL